MKRLAIAMMFAAGCDVATAAVGNKPTPREALLERKVELLEKQIAEREKQDADRRSGMDNCLLDAEIAYWNYIKLNGWRKRGTKPSDEIWRAPMTIWNQAADDKRNAIETCKATWKKEN